MAIQSGGTNISTLFMARVNTKRADVNIDDNGTDISNIYEAIGDGTPRANTNIKSGNVDIATLFRDINDPLGPNIGGDWPDSETVMSTTTVVGSTAQAGFITFDGDGEYERKHLNTITSKDYLDSVGAGNGSGFYIRRTSWTGDTPVTNLTTSWQELDGTTYYFYVSRTTLGSSTTNVTISIAPQASTTNEVTWTGSMTALVETEN